VEVTWEGPAAVGSSRYPLLVGGFLNEHDFGFSIRQLRDVAVNLSEFLQDKAAKCPAEHCPHKDTANESSEEEALQTWKHMVGDVARWTTLSFAPLRKLVFRVWSTIALGRVGGFSGCLFSMFVTHFLLRPCHGPFVCLSLLVTASRSGFQPCRSRDDRPDSPGFLRCN